MALYILVKCPVRFVNDVIVGEGLVSISKISQVLFERKTFFQEKVQLFQIVRTVLLILIIFELERP